AALRINRLIDVVGLADDVRFVAEQPVPAEPDPPGGVVNIGTQLAILVLADDVEVLAETERGAEEIVVARFAEVVGVDVEIAAFHVPVVGPSCEGWRCGQRQNDNPEGDPGPEQTHRTPPFPPDVWGGA